MAMIFRFACIVFPHSLDTFFHASIALHFSSLSLARLIPPVPPLHAPHSPWWADCRIIASCMHTAVKSRKMLKLACRGLWDYVTRWLNSTILYASYFIFFFKIKCSPINGKQPRRHYRHNTYGNVNIHSAYVPAHFDTMFDKIHDRISHIPASARVYLLVADYFHLAWYRFHCCQGKKFLSIEFDDFSFTHH